MEPLGKRYRSLREAVADEIRGWILSGAFKPGDRLVEDDLARRLGVSRMPVREALSVLETEGFVELVPRRGASVAAISPDEALELFEVRSMLEGLAARLAARRRDSQALAAIAEIVASGRQAVKQGDLGVMPDLHQRFHIALAQAGGNSYLFDLTVHLPAKIEWIYATEVRERAPVSWPEHAQILDAVRKGDEDLAERVTRLHVDESAQEFVAMIAKSSDSAAAR